MIGVAYRIVLLNRIVLLAVLAVVGSLSTELNAQQQIIPPALKLSFDLINQDSVASTVKFLSSDEMAGRDTPSRELEAASAYVAKRFRDARLKGLGDEGSFFQSTEIATVTIPSEGVVVHQNGNPVKHFGMLSADSKPFSFQGKIENIGDGSDRDKKYNGPVCLTAKSFDSRRAQSNFVSKLARIRRNGATAILVQVEPEHELVKKAVAALRPTIVRARGGSAGHVVLIAKTETDGVFHLELPPQSGGSATVSNVIGMIPGSDPVLSKEAVIFSAHLDHIGHQGNIGDTICNGADDNASGVTGVLTLAEAFAVLAAPPKRTVIFMTFWGEEKGLLGSRYYCKHPKWPLEKTIAMVNLEMIGRPEPGANEKCWGTGWDKSDLSLIHI